MTFLAPAIFLIHDISKNDQKMTGAKKFKTQKKISFFMPVNHAKKYLKSVDTVAFFLMTVFWNLEFLV